MELLEKAAIRHYQERIINRLLVILSLIAIPAVIVSLVRIITIGWQHIFSLHILVLLTLAVSAIKREVTAYQLKVYILIAVFVAVGVGSVVTFGIGNVFMTYTMTSIFMGIMFLSKRSAWFITAGTSVAFIMIAFMYVNNILEPAVGIDSYVKSSLYWLNISTGFIFIFPIIIITGGELFHLVKEQNFQLRELNDDLSRANAEVRTLQGILPICASCKKIRDDNGYWNQIESYIRDHSEADFSHSICPECVKELYPDLNNDD